MVLDTIQPTVSMGSLFMGIGMMVFMFVISYFLWQLGKLYRGIVENILHWSVLEDILLKQYCQKKNIDLEKELLKREFVRDNRKNLTKKIKEEIYNDFFGKIEKK